jgi:Gpi18-like mannosyltransferase
MVLRRILTKGKSSLVLGATLLLAFLLRFFCFPYKTHWSDMLFWKGWGEKIVEVGLGRFYQQVNSDYLPLFLLILGLVKKVYNFLPFSQVPIDYFYKTPAAIFDLFCGVLIFKLVKPSGYKRAILATIAFLFNPAVFGTSALWGQVDIIGTFFILLAFTLLSKGKNLLAGISLGLALLTKPIFLLGLAVFLTVFLKKIVFGPKKGKVLKEMTAFFVSCLLIVWLIALLFVGEPQTCSQLILKPFRLILEQLVKNSSWYPYTAVNAFNFWFLVDQDFWLSDRVTFWSLSYQSWGIVITGLFAFLILLRLFLIKGKKGDEPIFLSFALLVYTGFLFLTRIHERHLFYALPFILLVGIKTKRLLGSFALASLFYTLNLYFALENFLQGGKWVLSPFLVNLISLGNIFVFFWLWLEFAFYRK